MRRWFSIVGTILVIFGAGCQEKRAFSVPVEIGRGLPEADSLRALLDWLEGQSTYAADTLRLYVAFELIKTVGRQNPDSAYRLAQHLEALTRKSSYSLAKALSRLGWSEIYLRRAMYDSVLYQAGRALKVLGERRHDRLKVQALHYLGLGYQNKGDYDSALAYYQEAITIRKLLRDGRGLAASYNNIGNIYYAQGRYPEALEYHQKARQIREELGDKTGLAPSYNNIGNIYYAQGRYAEALEYYQKARQIQEELRDKAGLVFSYYNIGNIYSAQGRYAEALEYYQKARQIQEELEGKAGLAAAYNSIGNIYSAQGRYAEALEYLQKARQIQEELGDKAGLAAVYNSIGNIYSDQGWYAEALGYHQKARQIQEELGDKAGLAASYNNIGVIYKAQGRYAEALEYLQKAIQMGEALGDQYSLTFSYAAIGDLYRAQGQSHLGRPYLLKALHTAQKLNANDRLVSIYGLLSRTDSLLAASGQPTHWKSAYEYARLYHAYSDSVINEETIRKQAQLESQYEYDKKTALLKAEQEKERALATAELKRRETQRNFSLVALGIALIGMAVFAVLYRTIRKQKKLLQAQAQEIRQKNIALEQYNAELQSTNQALEASYRVIQEQAEALREKNEEILDSIMYAERIQRAILPSEEKWRRLLPESFLMYMPRDIVAGDFYWLVETERYIFLGVADATGHGVPGAFVSLVCSSALNKAVIEEGIESPGEILTRAKEVVGNLLTQEGGKLRDGMDIALVRFEREAKWRMSYAGANRPLWIVTADGEVMELKPTRQPVGYTEEEKPFEEVELDLRSRLPVMMYGFTDGIVDQMGGPKGRKLLPKGLRQVLLEVYREPVATQGDKVRQFFVEWRGEMRQMDDVTLVGVRVG